MARRKKLTGQKSLFRHKVRKPVSLTLTRRHHRQVRAAMKRLGLTRADLIALLIERHADTLDEETLMGHISGPPKPAGKKTRI